MDAIAWLLTIKLAAKTETILCVKNYTSLVSVAIVLVVPASVIVVRDEELLLPLNKTTKSTTTITPLTIHTHGAAYHSVCVEVVVVFTDVLELSWPKQIN